jgi:hypothetical protein
MTLEIIEQYTNPCNLDPLSSKQITEFDYNS